MVKAKGSANTDAKVVAHVATAPNSYDSIMSLLLGKDLTDKDILKYTREQYRSYWKQHFARILEKIVAIVGITIPLRHTR
jgi:membrane protein YqaA with SNARE-associated domain